MRQYIFFLLLICFHLPMDFLAQVPLQKEEDTPGLTDPETYPFTAFITANIPGDQISLDLGFQNIRSLYNNQGIDLPRLKFFLGFTSGFRYKRIWLEINFNREISAIETIPFDNQSFIVQDRSHQGGINLGATIWQNRNSSVVLWGGVGSSLYQISVLPVNRGGQVDFDNLATGSEPPIWPVVFHENTFGDLGIEFRLGRPKNRTSLGSSYRLGYRHGFNEQAWQTIGNSSINAPMDRISQIYLMANFNLGFNRQLNNL